MDVESLRLFVEIARRGSFAAVSRELDRDPSAVSRVVAALEAELGLRLFQRSTRRMSLTEAGALYLARIEPLLDELERAGSEALQVSAAPTGTLRLTASVTFGQSVIVPLLAQFRRRYPSVQIDGLFTDSNVDLVAERIDLAVRLASAVGGDVIAAKLMDTRYRVVASATYLATAPPLAAPADLSGHACLLFPLRAFRSRWLFRDRGGSIVEVPIRGDITLAPAGALRDAAIAGLGPALLPDWLVDADIRAGRLVRVLTGHDVTATTFDTAAWLLYPSRAFVPGKVRAMIDFLRERLSRTADLQS